jgi:hypothetical protein
LRLPYDGGVGFLEGCWRSDTDQRGSESDRELAYVYCFTESGEADVKLELKGGAGDAGLTCDGEGTASISGGVLTVQDGGFTCPAGTANFVPNTVVCRPGEGGDAECLVKSRSGAEVPARFTYLGPRG